ncbi:hypothetical protein JW949_03430 [Candidatus Woesearchaeota archaeon]|nr:hypothetical protein [Candidatus Woesearchaeota archaeon]
MKNIGNLITKSLVLLLMMIVVSAAVYSLDFGGDINLGSDSQERENTVSTTITLTNDDSVNVTSIVLTHDINSEFEVNITPNIIVNLINGTSQNIDISVYVPDDFDAGNYQIGTITATGSSNGSTVTETADVYLEAENNLFIDKVTVSVDGDSDKVGDGNTVDEEAKPNSEIEIEIIVENKGDIDMEDVEVTIEADDDEIGFDDDDEDIGDINNDDKETVTFSFDVDSDADDGDYDITITVEGEDENGARHGEEWEITIEVDRETHEIMIKDVEIEPQAGNDVEVCDDYFDIEFVLSNTGKKDEDDVSFKIYSNDMDYEKYLYELSIDEGEQLEKSVRVVLPDDIKEGSYFFQLWSYYDNDEESDLYGFDLNVVECEEEEKDEEEETVPDFEVEVPETYTPTGRVVYGKPETFLFTESELYFVVLVLAVFILGAGIIALLYSMSRMQK